MAQSGYTPILIYASGTATNVPLAANMTSTSTGAELAINYTDGKLYYKNNSGVVTLLASTSGASGDVVGPASATDNALARFDLTTGKLIQNSVGILSDAGILTGLTGLTSSGSITLSSLTSGRITYAGTAGLLQDSANLTFNGTTLTANTIGAYTLSGTIAGGGNQINNVIIGTATPLAGSFTTINASTSITNAGLTSGRVTYAGASGLLSDSSTLTYDGTSLTTPRLVLGGTTLPSAGAATLFSRTSDNNTYLQTGSGNNFNLLDGSQNTMATFSPTALNFNISNTERMRLNSTGLGIGTSSPRLSLDVSGSVLVGTYQTSTNYATLNVKPSSTITTPSTFTNAINIWNGTNVGEYSNITFGYNSIGLTNAPSYFGFVSTSSSGAGKGDFVFGTRDVTTDTAATERMRITSAGLVGIGTTDPDYGSYGATERILGITGVATYRGRLSLQNTSTGTTGVAGTIAFFNGSTTLAAIDVNADGATNKGLFAFNTNNGTSVSERMRIDSSGNVGIGISSPVAPLNIMGLTSSTSTPILYLQQGGAFPSYGYTFKIDNVATGNLFLNRYDNNVDVGNLLTVTGAGNVGIGTSSPAFKTEIVGGATTVETTLFQVRSDAGGIGTGSTIAFANSTNASAGSGRVEIAGIRDTSSGSSFVVRTADSGGTIQERMRIDSSGNLLVGTTSSLGGKLEVGSSYVRSTNGASSQGVGYVAGDSSGNDWHFGRSSANGYYYIVTQAGTGQYMITGTSVWVAVSDERYKENLVPITDALSKVNTLRAVTGNLTSEKNNTKPYLIAQDVQKVLPEAVDSSNPEKLGLAYTDVIPLLVAAIKELKAEVDSLKQQINGE